MPVPSHVVVDSLSGPDTIPAKTPANAQASPQNNPFGQPIPLLFPSYDPRRTPVKGQATTVYTDALSGTTDTPSDRRVVRSPAAHSTETDPGSPLPAGELGGDPDYYFNGTMSEELLHKYLDRSIDMDGVSVWQVAADTLAPDGHIETSGDHDNQVNMITDIGAKFAMGMISFWEPWQTPAKIAAGLIQFKADADLIHTIDPDVICEGRVFEDIGMEAGNGSRGSNVIPDYVFIDFFGLPAPTTTQYFDYGEIKYNSRHEACADYPKIDITRLQAQMWYYYLATQYILHGAESIHFGDIYEINCNDAGNESLWKVVSLVRKFAAGTNLSNTSGRPNARRGLVLCNAHINLSPLGGNSRNSIYYDPIFSSPVEDWQRQLIFDFHSFALQGVLKPALSFVCAADFLPVYLDSSVTLWKDITSGGLHPLGWYCSHNACTLNNDNGANSLGYGCRWYDDPRNMWNTTWGYDEASWFLAQSDTFKDKIIPYLYFGVKCINPYVHYYMPGRLFSSPDRYAAYGSSQEVTIANAWNGLYPTPYDWVFHDFISENVANPYYDGSPVSGLVFVGTDKMYYIGADHYIHGLIKVGGNYNDGTWLTTSPSYASDVPIALQVKANSDLVASPDGSRLLYIGIDGFIYGFDIINAWTYTYLNINSPTISIGTLIIEIGGFMKNELNAQSIRAVRSLIYTDQGIFYVGEWLGDRTNRVHGFVYDPGSGGWSTVSPSYSAVTTNPIAINDQTQAFGAITYDSHSNRLFYVGIDGLLYYFIIIDIWTYYYVECSRSYQMHALNLQIQGNIAIHYYAPTDTTIIYFVAFNRWDFSRRLCCIKGTGSADWVLMDEVWDGSGDYFSIPQSDGFGNIAVSIDGNTIAYIGSDHRSVIFFGYIDGFRFPYSVTLANDNGESNSLQFRRNDELFYLSPASSTVIQRMKFEKAYCQNPAVLDFPI